MLGTIQHGDCIAGMQRLDDGCIDLAFADPPFNIGFKYDVYNDSLETDDYLRWSQDWIAQVHRVLKPDGAFWLAIGDEYAAELKVLSQRVGFTCRSWVIWYYTFGVNCKFKFTRSHAHLFYFVKDAEHFKFNSDDPAVRVPSARQLVYNDARANSKGRLPDDTWILRPQDLPSGFTADEDVWYFPRVAGTFKERAGFHGCQMPEQLLGRVIRSCSDLDDVVLDPFSGSATTVAVAKKLHRRFVSFDMSQEYVELGTARLERIEPGDPLDGATDPLRSVPATSEGKLSIGATMTLPRRTSPQPLLSFDDDGEIVLRSFAKVAGGCSADRVLLDPVLRRDFEDACRDAGGVGSPTDWRRKLLELRLNGAIAMSAGPITEPTIFPDAVLWRWSFATEIAWRELADRFPGWELEDWLIDDAAVEAFDVAAGRHAPGVDRFQLRWTLLKLRRWWADALPSIHALAEGLAEPRWTTFAINDFDNVSNEVPEAAVVYQLIATVGHEEAKSPPVLHIGETTNLSIRLADHFATDAAIAFWKTLAEAPISVRWCEVGNANLRRRWQGALVQTTPESMTNAFSILMTYAAT